MSGVWREGVSVLQRKKEGTGGRKIELLSATLKGKKSKSNFKEVN